MNKKAQTQGLVSGLVFGIAGLVIGVIVAFVIVGTLTNSNLLASSRVTVSVTNESGSANMTGYTLSLNNITNTNFIITSIWVDYNETTEYRAWGTTNTTSGGYNISVPLENVTFNGQANVTNATIYDYFNASLSYTYQPFSQEENTVNFTKGNFSSGVNNVSSKIPTVLLIAAIVLIMGILAVLVGVWQRMKMGGSI